MLDKTKTAMGARMLRSFVEQPLISRERILDRQNAVEELNMNYISREEMAEYLNAVCTIWSGLSDESATRRRIPEI